MFLNIIQKAFEHLFVHLSIIIVLHIICFALHNKNYSFYKK